MHAGNGCFRRTHNRFKNANPKQTCNEVSLVSTKVLEDIREELQEIKLLYKELIDKLIPTQEPTKEEKKAIAEEDEIADEEELMETLG
jgi:hypothetical protein